MRRLLSWSRPVTALFALWFAIVLGDPGVLHSCAMHGAGHGGHAAEPSAAMSGAHAGHAMAHGESSTRSHEPAAPATCTCIGHCCAAAAAAPVPAVVALVLPALTVMPPAPLAPPASEVPASPDLRLPFANGPPAI